MYCETCPIRNYCKAYEVAEKDNGTSYQPQQVVRVESYADPPCPLLKIAKAKEGV